MQAPTGSELAAAFDAPEPHTVGLEEEVMLLDPATLELTDRAGAVLERLRRDDTGRGRFKLELPASQVELVTPPRANVGAAIRDLSAARSRLVEACDGLARPAAAGVHPFSAVEGRVNDGPRYERTVTEYGATARRQLVCALQVHVAVGSADRTLAVYNALRPLLPQLAALAANAPVYEGRVTDLASVRPGICRLLPRQGVPAAFESWDAVAAELRWGAAAGAVADQRSWWWELRPHPRWGTLELRVPDAQTTLADAAAVASVCHALVVTLAETATPAVAVPTWRIEENRWSASRHGVEGSLADLETGERRPTRRWLADMLDSIEPVALGLGAAGDFEHARALVERNGAMRQRAVARELGARGLAGWLADRFGP